VDRNHSRHKRITPRDVARTTDILASVIKVGTARVAQLGRVPAWGKTGTTENYGDAWFVGATEKYTVAVWVGYPNGLRPMRSEYRGEPVAGGTFPAQIWRDFLLAVLQADQDRTKRQCEREQAKRKDDATPSDSVTPMWLPSDLDILRSPLAWRGRVEGRSRCEEAHRRRGNHAPHAGLAG